MLRIIQLSDCHVSADAEAKYRGISPRASLETLLEAVRQWSPGLVLVTGDLSEDASNESYAWLASQLSGLGVPVMAIPGNHDDAGLMREHFTATAVDAPLNLEKGGWQLVMLNSSVENEVPGRFDEGQLEMLDDCLAGSESHALIALHHQPMPVGSAWIDRYPLLDAEPFWQILSQHPKVRIVTWGHIHHAIALECGGIASLGSPSTVANSLPGREKFSFDPLGPACRWFELETDGTFRTGLLTSGAADRKQS